MPAAAKLFHQIIEMGMPSVHLSAVYGIDHDFGRFRRTKAAAGCRYKPVIMIGGHQNEFTPPMPRDFDRLAARTMLNFVQIALEFDCGRLAHAKPSLMVVVNI